MKSAGKARNNGLYRHIRTSKEIIRNLLNDYIKLLEQITTKIEPCQQKSFENTPLSAKCKKMLPKLWQKERGPDAASPLDIRKSIKNRITAV